MTTPHATAAARRLVADLTGADDATKRLGAVTLLLCDGGNGQAQPDLCDGDPRCTRRTEVPFKFEQLRHRLGQRWKGMLDARKIGRFV